LYFLPQLTKLLIQSHKYTTWWNDSVKNKIKWWNDIVGENITFGKEGKQFLDEDLVRVLNLFL
jgi:hypothetical protein